MKALRNFMNKIKPHFQQGGKFSKLESVFDGMETFLFTPNTTSRSGVHIHDSNDMKRTMITVVVALLPCLLFAMCADVHLRTACNAPGHCGFLCCGTWY